LDEVNFWSPKAGKPFKNIEPGAPLFFRLGDGVNKIVGYAFEAHFAMLTFEQAWTAFETKNGFKNRLEFFEWGAINRGLGLPEIASAPLACTILREAMFWPRERWIPWGEEQGWARTGIQQGKYERDPGRASRLLQEISLDRLGVPSPEEFTSEFELVDADEREVLLARSRERRGQGTFRTRLLSAYDSKCAITGEHTEPVLDAAHVQPYLGQRSNHVQNGLLLTKEFHALFDAGLVTITKDYSVRVSSRIRERWRNGHRYYPYDDKQLVCLPEDPAERPSLAALEWHARRVFVA
jgi:putative restriction endonuclease